MRRNRPSLTAAAVAPTRALESERPPDERICYDPFAHLFVSLRFWTFWFSFAEFFFEFGRAEKRGPASMGVIVARERYIDDYLQSCIEGGLEQLVILGLELIDGTRAAKCDCGHCSKQSFCVDSGKMYVVTEKGKS